MEEELVIICAVNIEDAYEIYARLDTYLARFERSVVFPSNFPANPPFLEEMVLVPSTGLEEIIYGEPRGSHQSVSVLR